jgi:hypothetical protein
MCRLEAGAPSEQQKPGSRGVRSTSTPHTSGTEPPPPTRRAVPGRDGGGLGLGGRRPSELSMNIHPTLPYGESLRVAP